MHEARGGPARYDVCSGCRRQQSCRLCPLLALSATESSAAARWSYLQEALWRRCGGA